MPHRFSFDAIKESTDWYITGKENAADLHRWSDRLIKATRQRRDLNASEIADKQEREQYKKEVDRQIDEMENARKNLIDKVEAGNKLTLTSDATQAFLKYANSLHGNIPDYGPHIGVNIQVSNRVHLNVGKAGTITPGSLAALSMTPKRGRGVALTSDGKALVTTGGYKLNLDELSKKLQKLIRERGTDNTTINKDDLMEDDEK